MDSDPHDHLGDRAGQRRTRRANRRKDLGARVVLVHVRKDPSLFNSTMERERATPPHHAGGREILDRANDVLPSGVDADERVELGVAADQLSQIADTVGAALIVVGTRGRGPLASALLGSVSQTLARQARCPVMIVPDRTSGDGPRSAADAPRERSTIVAGVDSPETSSGAARLARELAASLDDRLLIVHPHAAVGPPAHALQAMSAREGARLIVIGAGYGGDVRFPLFGSVAGQLPRLAPCPVIVLPERVAASLDQVDDTDVRRAA